MAPNSRVALLSLALTVAAVLGTFVGGIPIVSVLLLLIAPLAFVVGVSGLIASLIPTQRTWIRVLAFTLLLPVVGLNTRIPVLFQPLERSVSAYPVKAVELNPEDWVRLESDDEQLSARLKPLAAPDARCSEGCFGFEGFRMPLPLERDKYWLESPEISLLQKGISLSGGGAPKSYLRVVTESSGVRRQRIKIELLDASKRRLGFASEEFRTGLPWEPPDGEDASGLDYLLHANPIALFAASRVAKSNPYPVHQFVEKSLVVKSENPNTTRAVTLDINENEPMPARPAEWSGRPYEDLIATYTRRREECESVFTKRGLDEHLYRDILYGNASALKSQAPIVFARDRAGSLIGYMTRETIAVRCDEDSIYAMTDNISPLAVMRIVRYDHFGVANVSITADVTNPRNQLSYVDLGTLKFSLNGATFTRWYWTIRPLAFAQRQDIELVLPN